MTKTYAISKAFELTPEGTDKAVGWDLFVNDNWAQRFKTKAQAKLAQDRAETEDVLLEMPPLTSETILERAEIAQHNAAETEWVDPIKWIEPTLDEAMTNLVTVKTMKKVKTVKTGVGAEILLLIAQGHLSNKEIVAKVLEDNPMRKTTYACVAWYQSQVKAGKIDLPEVTEESEETTEE